jgi:hypothetical protein
LAIGQRNNKGVFITFRPDALSGSEHLKPGTGDIAGREYQTDIVAPRAIYSVEMAANDVKQLRGVTRNRLTNFVREDIGNGIVRFTRSDLGADGYPAKIADAEPQQAPKPEAAAPARSAEPAQAPADTAAAGRPAEVETGGLTDGQKVEAESADARIEALRAEFPDMEVMLDGMDGPMKLDDFLASVKAEADEMVADAPLMKVAAECAILNGV